METSRHTGRNRPGQAGPEGTCRKNRSGWAQQETSGPAARATGPQGRLRPYGPAVRNASGRHGPTGPRSKAAKRTPACGPMEPRRPQQGPGTQAGGRGAIQRAALPCRNDGNVTNRPQRRGTSEGRTTKGTPATAVKRARASEAPAGDEPAAGHRRGLAAPARNMPEKPKRSTGQAKRQEPRPSPRLPKGTSERCGSEGAKGGCRRPAAPRRSRGASLPQESGVPEGLPQGEGDTVRVRPRRGCKTSTRTTNPARSAKDATEQTSATRPGAKAQPGAEGRRNRKSEPPRSLTASEGLSGEKRTSHSRPARRAGERSGAGPTGRTAATARSSPESQSELQVRRSSGSDREAAVDRSLPRPMESASPPARPGGRHAKHDGPRGNRAARQDGSTAEGTGAGRAQRSGRQLSAKRSPAAMTGTKLPGHREAERTKAGGRSCSLEGRAGPTDKRCRKGQTTAVPAPSPAELARHNAPGGQTAGRSRTGENLRAQKAPLLPHYQSSLTRPSGSAEAGESSS